MIFVETNRLLLRKVAEEDFAYFQADLADKEMDQMMLRWPCETEEDIRLGFEWFLYKEERAYAIVHIDNDPAIRLYESMGFAKVQGENNLTAHWTVPEIKR